MMTHPPLLVDDQVPDDGSPMDDSQLVLVNDHNAMDQTPSPNHTDKSPTNEKTEVYMYMNIKTFHIALTLRVFSVISMHIITAIV